MSNETLDIIQEMLGLIRAQGRRLAQLEANNALQNCALTALLENAGNGLEPSPDTVELYRAVRKSAAEIADTADGQEELRVLLRLLDSRLT